MTFNDEKMMKKLSNYLAKCDYQNIEQDINAKIDVIFQNEE